MTEKNYYVYIMTNTRNTVLYTGVTNDLERRIYEHKAKLDSRSFTSNYNATKLVCMEQTCDVNEAIGREKQIKSGSRRRKIALIEKENKEWKDLSEEWYETGLL